MKSECATCRSLMTLSGLCCVLLRQIFGRLNEKLNVDGNFDGFPKSMPSTQVFSVKLKRNKKDSRPAGRESKPVPSEYEAGNLT